MVVCYWLIFHPSASLRSLPAVTMLAASSRATVVTFRNVSRRPVDNESNLFATPQGTAAKFSVVHLPLKWRVSRTPLHSAAAPILNPESERRASQTIGSHLHKVDPSLVNATPPAACALGRHFIFSLPRWCRLARREANCVRDGTLYYGSRKESSRTKTGSATTEFRRRSYCWRSYCAVDLQRPAVINDHSIWDLSAPSDMLRLVYSLWCA